jgi:hypothetical protein
MGWLFAKKLRVGHDALGLVELLYVQTRWVLTVLGLRVEVVETWVKLLVLRNV